MMRTIGALALATLLASAAPQPRPVLDARFIGNMAFAISDGQVTLMTDFPYQSGYSRYMTYDPAMIRSSTPATLSLITHRHHDHWEPALFGATGWKVAGPADVVANVDVSRVVPLDGRGAFGPIAIEAIETPHASIGHYSYILSWHGRRLYFSGDTESPDSLLSARDLDAAFVSSWQYRAALRTGRRIDARQIVIYHHQSGEKVPECGEGCTVPRQGDVLRF
jgi:L-ascorbate metabolism protein UlaG (beta-lactamase superfamily)